jgi:hypothetical protein
LWGVDAPEGGEEAGAIGRDAGSAMAAFRAGAIRPRTVSASLASLSSSDAGHALSQAGHDRSLHSAEHVGTQQGQAESEIESFLAGEAAFPRAALIFANRLLRILFVGRSAKIVEQRAAHKANLPYWGQTVRLRKTGAGGSRKRASKPM